jgi:sialate O-acetylesterase
MAVIYDVGNKSDIHPRNKKEVGRRLALHALAKTYGKSDTIWSGPVFKSLKQEGAKLRVTFDHAHGGLKTRDGKSPSHFEIIGAETGFVAADAVIDGDSVVLSSAACPAPVAVRFGWHKTAEPNLCNGEGLPAMQFRAGEVPKIDTLNKVPVAKDFKLVYDLDLANLGPNIKYDADNTAAAPKFDRVAYFLELQKGAEPTRYLFVSMDAFTTDAKKLGIPTVASKIRFQQAVSNLSVFSNVPEIKTGESLGAGNIEFWPDNYGPFNFAKVPGADDAIWDFGDQYMDPENGYGSMQIHNPAAKQTLIAINHWVGGPNADIGIGNSPGDKHDWTFAANAGTYTAKRLRVLVHPAP